ncbi:MAG: phospho-sugar mutase, partial [Propionibacteriaceae bacterium]
MPLTADLAGAIDAWRAIDPDHATVTTLTQLRDDATAGNATALAELESAFAGPLEFGTAGLRGPLGPGPARMNRVVVTRAAAGFAAWLRERGLHEVNGAPGKVIIGYDARYNSAVFARDTAEVFAGAGFEPLLLDQNTPTPVVAFGIKHYGAVAGIVVTASHNPPEDNGYKVYLGDGSQIIAPTDAQIAQLIAEVAQRPLSAIARSNAITMVGDELVAAYVSHSTTLGIPQIPAQRRGLTWVYTAMHGVGARVVHRVIEANGLPQPHIVEEQEYPDPDFPTVAFPNPEEKGAIDLAIAKAKATGATLVVANDPDADRCAIALNIAGQWRMVKGDELGSMFAAIFLEQKRAGVYANSIVSSTLLGDMAKAHGMEHQSTLTGFKWIGRVPGLAFGYEEAIGYCCDAATVPDKDGITALLWIVAVAQQLADQGKTLESLLEQVITTYGLYATDQLSVRVTDLSIISTAMDKIRATPPT